MLAWSPRNCSLWAPEPREDYTCVRPDQKFPHSTWELRPDAVIVERAPQLAGGNVYKYVRYYIECIGARFLAALDQAGRLWKFIMFVCADTGITDHAGGTFPSQACMVFADVQRDFCSNVYFTSTNPWTKFSASAGKKIGDCMTPQAMPKSAMI